MQDELSKTMILNENLQSDNINIQKELKNIQNEIKNDRSLKE